MIDWDFEARLVDRITAREVIARAGLTPRQLHVFCDWVRSNDTLKAVGEREGLGKARVGQIVDKALRRVKARANAQPLAPDPPQRFSLRATPPGFDKAEFLRHQQFLIERRAIQAAATFARERAELDRLLATEAEQKAPGNFDKFEAFLKSAVKPAPWPEPKPEPAPLADEPAPLPIEWSMLEPSSPAPKSTPVEPWFDLSRLPTPKDLQALALYAINYLVASRGWWDGQNWLGTLAAHVVCTRTADTIAAAMHRLARELPAKARLSTQMIPVAPGMLGASFATGGAAMRVVSVHEGKAVSIEITYDAQ